MNDASKAQVIAKGGIGIPQEVFNLSDSEPAVALIARSAADEEEQTIPYDRESAR